MTLELDTSKAVKVHIDWQDGPFKDPEPDSFGGESPWAIPVGDGLYQLCNQPLTEGLEWGDIVRCKTVTEHDGDEVYRILTVVELVSRPVKSDEGEDE